MSRASAIADTFEQANSELGAVLESLTDGQWLAPGANTPGQRMGDVDEDRPIGVIAHHVAVNHALIISIARSVAEGSGPTPPLDIPKLNADHAAANPSPPRAETIALLAAEGRKAAEWVRGLSDEQLERPREGPGMANAELILQRVLIGHVSGHLAAIRAAAGG